MTELLSLSPRTMSEDEHVIAKGYKKQTGITLFIILAGCASTYLDLKYVVAAGCLTVFAAVTFCEARLYDLCIRLKRSNHLAQENGEKLRELRDLLKGLDNRVFHIINAFDIETKSTNKLNEETKILRERLQGLASEFAKND
jgi:hypothetical protein